LVGSRRSSVFDGVELALVDHVDGLDASDQSASAAKVLESEHGAYQSLDGPVILLDEVVQVLSTGCGFPHL
jgi:hypothetical protein